MKTADGDNWHPWSDRGWGKPLCVCPMDTSARLSFQAFPHSGFLPQPLEAACLASRCFINSHTIIVCSAASSLFRHELWKCKWGDVPFWAVFSKSSVPSSLSPGTGDASFHLYTSSPYEGVPTSETSLATSVLRTLRSWLRGLIFPTSRPCPVGARTSRLPVLPKPRVWGDASPAHPGPGASAGFAVLRLAGPHAHIVLFGYSGG